MLANDYQAAALRTARVNDLTPNELMTNGVLGLCGESGECADLVKKFLYQGHEMDREKLMDEIGDCLWYAAVTAYSIGYDLEYIFDHNIEKLRKRYPDGFDSQRSIHRPEYEKGGIE